MAQLHDQAALHMPAEAQLQLLTVLQVCCELGARIERKLPSLHVVALT